MDAHTLREILGWLGFICAWLAYPLLWYSGYLKGKTAGLREAMREYQGGQKEE